MVLAPSAVAMARSTFDQTVKFLADQIPRRCCARWAYGHRTAQRGSPKRRVLPFVPLMAGTKADAIAALRHMRDVADDDIRRELLMRFMLLGGLRYDKIELLKLVEERSMVTLDDLRESSFYQFIVEEGLAEGLEKGMAEGLERGLERGLEKGKEIGEAKLLRRLLERRFGPLPSWAIERMNGADRAVEAWADRFVDANGIPLEELLST